LLLLAACAPNNDPGSNGSIEAVRSAADEQVQLKLSWWGSPTRDSRTLQVIQMFEAENPNITFTVEHYPNTQAGGIGVAYWPTLNQHAADGTLPDIMQHDYAYIADWTQRGLLRALDDLVQDGSLDLSDVPPGLVDGGRVGGKLMGVSLGTNTQTIVIDLDVFAAAGIPVPADDWSWQDFKAIAMRIKESQNIWGAGSGLHGYTPGWKAITLSTGQWVWSADGKSLGYTDDRPWIHDWHLLLSLRDAGAIPTIAQEPGGSNVEALPLVTGRSAMESIFSNQLVALWTAAGVSRNLKLLPLPGVRGGISPVYMKPSQYFAITANCAHPKEAAKFIDFFTNSVAANQILQGERGVPIASKVLAALQPTLSRMAAESFALIARATAYATKLPPIDPPAWDTILTTIFTPKVELPIMRGEITPEDGVALFRREASAALAGSP
jgi:multiple sugar transport system substrate-binding protein